VGEQGQELFFRDDHGLLSIPATARRIIT